MTQAGHAFVQDARRRGGVCQLLDRIPEVLRPLGDGEAVIPDALLNHQHNTDCGRSGSILRAFVEVDRATMGPNASPPHSAPTPASPSTCPRPRPAASPT
ncbi:hypothetical protein ACIGO6_40155 [Streptomyces sp. NPDC053750]|uniref:hypothetical protein n=1 Tax=Streptomyces sp. NPDC053750 TaxID=3365714 RepID=UPI0037D59C79